MTLMAILFYYYFRQRSIIVLRNNRFFTRTLALTFVSVFLDTLSIVAISGLGVIPEFWVIVVCKLYLCSLVLTSLLSFFYLLDDVYNSEGKHVHRLYRIYTSGSVLCCLSILFLPINIHDENILTNIYTDGPSVVLTYLFSLLMISSSFFMIFRKKEQMNETRREAILFWMILWGIAAIIQYFTPHLLIVGFAASLGMMILFLKLENPDTYLNQSTGVYNPYAFRLYLKDLFENHERANMLDINILRPTGGTYNKEISPKIIREVVLFLNNMDGVVVFEVAEDEYILLIKKHYKTEDIMEQVRDRFERGWGTPATTHVNIHCSSVSDTCPTENVDEFLALLRYNRKKSKDYTGWDITQIDEGLYAQMRHELDTEQLIIHAIERNKIEVFYQPIYSTREGCFSSAEALARIRNEDGSIVPPGVFIPIAEENGMILRVGEIVFEKVCAFLQTNQGHTGNLKRIEVNLSVVQCAYEHLADDYIAIMQEYQVDPTMINLEITESASFKTKEILLENMHKLMDYGVRFSLDDFGTGRSNLNYIIDMPVDIVKFDRELTVAYFEDTKTKCVIDAAMQMIRALQLSIVSEGIEEKEQFEIMQSLGIEYIQGFYFSKPLPQKEYIHFLQNHYTNV